MLPTGGSTKKVLPQENPLFDGQAAAEAASSPPDADAVSRGQGGLTPARTPSRRAVEPARAVVGGSPGTRAHALATASSRARQVAHWTTPTALTMFWWLSASLVCYFSACCVRLRLHRLYDTGCTPPHSSVMTMCVPPSLPFVFFHWFTQWCTWNENVYAHRSIVRSSVAASLQGRHARRPHASPVMTTRRTVQRPPPWMKLRKQRNRHCHPTRCPGPGSGGATGIRGTCRRRSHPPGGTRTHQGSGWCTAGEQSASTVTSGGRRCRYAGTCFWWGSLQRAPLRAPACPRGGAIVRFRRLTFCCWCGGCVHGSCWRMLACGCDRCMCCVDVCCVRGLVVAVLCSLHVT